MSWVGKLFRCSKTSRCQLLCYRHESKLLQFEYQSKSFQPSLTFSEVKQVLFTSRTLFDVSELSKLLFISRQKIPKKSLKFKEFAVRFCVIYWIVCLRDLSWKQLLFSEDDVHLKSISDVSHRQLTELGVRKLESQRKSRKDKQTSPIYFKCECKVSINDLPCHLILWKPQHRHPFLYHSENCLNCKHRERKYTSTSALQPINKSESLGELFKRLISMHGVARSWGRKKRTRIATREFISRCFKIYLCSRMVSPPTSWRASSQINFVFKTSVPALDGRDKHAPGPGVGADKNSNSFMRLVPGGNLLCFW